MRRRFLILLLFANNSLPSSLLPHKAAPSVLVLSPVTSFRASSPHMALPSAQEAPPLSDGFFPASLRPPRSRPHRRPSRRDPFGIAVASVFQTACGGGFVAFSDIRPPPPQDPRLAITRRRCWTSRCISTVEHHHKSQAAQQPPSRISGPHPLVLPDPAPSPARLITTAPAPRQFRLRLSDTCSFLVPSLESECSAFPPMF